MLFQPQASGINVCVFGGAVMSCVRLLSIMVLSAGFAGCSMHPLPEDVTRASTVDIVKKIRCEARAAIIRRAVKDEKRLGIENEIENINNKNYNNVKFCKEKNKLKCLLYPDYKDAAIGYDFKFTISEGDAAAGNASFTFPFSNGKAFLGLGLGETKERKSDRSFLMVDMFWELLAVPKKECEVSSVSWRYPITGEIGLDEVMHTYLRLLEVGTLGRKFGGSAGSTKGSGGKPSGGGGNKDVDFIDELTFTTSYDGKVSPSAEINPVIHDLRLTKVSASFGGDRKDIHKVTISLLSKYEPEAREKDTSIKDAIRQGLRANRTERSYEQILDNVNK